MKEIIVNNDFQTLLQTIEDISKDKSKSILVLLTGSKDPNGQSWCPDCVRAEPVIHDVLSDKSDDTVLVTTYIDRDPWKKADNSFRTHSQLRAKCVPTLINWQTSNRLEEGQLLDKQLLEMLLEE
ncbi:unnamed protein product [Medioppia subpectinata]|uniref:Thioredoxin domain-containing protein 17 n=1 Tax=Medioppia subpectinata TaxID=1979941 RepID=A0A7R9Q220_9ACAR|nr:unnamed protein product [Medioppia subpectinata]CAG2109035.1 unnamed protein product [Medioppia subpectinata]